MKTHVLTGFRLYLIQGDFNNCLTFELDGDSFFNWIATQYFALAESGDNRITLLGKPLFHDEILIVLVAQTAEQSVTNSGNISRIQW